MMRVQGMLALPMLLVAAGVLVACDRVDETRGATAVVIGTTVAAPTSAAGTAAPAATASAAATAAPAGTAAATPAASSTASTPAQTAPPAATRAAASAAANVTLKEFAIAIDPNAIIAGQLSLTVQNSGAIPHEVVILKTDTNPRQLPISGGIVDEAQYNVIGAVREVGSGAVKTGTFNLDAGKYVLLCNIAGHPVAGMYTVLTVQ